MILDEWKKEPVSDRVTLSLVCKRLATDIAVRRSIIPRPVLHNSATAPKRQRLNFMLRLAPWFDNDAAENDDEIQATETARSQRRFEYMDKFVVVNEGWILCVKCLKYSQARIAMLDLNAHKYTDPAIPGRWMRCIIKREDETHLGERLCLDGVEANWTAIPADKAKLPDYCNPKIKIKKTNKITSTPKGKGNSKAQVKPKEKTDAPETALAAKGKGIASANAADAKAPEELTGLEDCHYLPVNAYGERVPEVSLCPLHTFDPLRFIGN